MVGVGKGGIDRLLPSLEPGYLCDLGVLACEIAL